MRKILLSILVLYCFTPSFSQRRLEKLWESDTVSIKGPESATFDPTSKMIYVSSMNNGNIVLMDLKGKVVKSDWVTGLTSNKGIGFHKGLLYTAETNTIAVIDMKTATLVKRIPVEGAIMLNDLEVDAKGIVYVSDTRAGKVYRVEGDKPSVYLTDISGANGLMAVGTDLYVAGSTTFQKVSANKEITKIGEGYEAGLDGIVLLSPTEFILSNYRGMLYYVEANGNKQVLQDTRDIKFMANDISYDSKSKTLFVPSFSSNKVTAYAVK
jgi:DNA-binding beta-propeller fold protein YncE